MHSILKRGYKVYPKPNVISHFANALNQWLWVAKGRHGWPPQISYDQKQMCPRCDKRIYGDGNAMAFHSEWHHRWCLTFAEQR